MTQTLKDTPDLTAAVQSAVQQSALMLDDLVSGIEEVFLETWQTAGELPELWALQAQVQEAVARHRRDAATFRVVLFGRTGAGKSSLVEALTGGDGRSISPGPSDWTTEPRPVDWGALELIDTPGIRGWGRTQTSESLEVIASRSVSRADLVLLCFDDSNQQAGEFTVVQREIQRYGRPCVAVLNVRNPRWRGPANPDHMAKVQRDVNGNAGHLRRELDVLGMTDVPIVAINTLRAVAARAGQGYAGHDAGTVIQRQLNLGMPALEGLSNLRRLEGLLEECLSQGAPALRLKAVEEDLIAGVTIGGQELLNLASKCADDLQDDVGVLRAGLMILGSGTGKGRGRWSREDVPGAAALETLERLRPELRAALRPDGALQRTARELFTVHVSPHRRELQEAAERVARKALDDSAVISAESLLAELEPAIEEAERAGQHACELLAAEFKTQLEGLSLTVDFTRSARRAEDVDGTTSDGRARAWAAADLGAAAIVAIAVFLVSSPVGWVVAGAGLFVSLFTSWRRRRAARKAEARRSLVRSEAVAVVRRAADDVYRTIDADLWGQVASSAKQLASGLLDGPAKELLRLAQRERSLRMAGSRLAALRTTRGDTQAGDVLRSACIAVRKRNGAKRSIDPLLGQDMAGLDGMPELSQASVRDLAALCDELRRRTVEWTRRSGVAACDGQTPASATVGLLGARGVGMSSLHAALDEYGDTGLSIRELGSHALEAHTCDLLVWLLGPNMTLTDLGGFDELLGPNSLVQQAVLSRSLFCVTRLDQLGPDLLTEPGLVVTVMQRKAKEVSDLLAGRGLDVDAANVAFVAPRPFGVAAEADLLEVAGLTQLIQLLRGTGSGLDDHRRRHTRIHDALGALRVAGEDCAVVQVRLDGTDEVLVMLEANIAERARELQRAEARLRGEIGDRVDGLAMTAVGASGKDALQIALAALANWPRDAEIVSLLESWQTDFMQTQERLSEEFASDLRDVLERQQLAGSLTFASVNPFTLDFSKQLNTSASLLLTAGKSRDAWYALVKFVTRGKFKFKPWGAIKGAAKAKAIGGVLAALGVVVTSLEIYLDGRASKKRDAVRDRVLSDARESVEEVLKVFLWWQSEDRVPGVDADVGLFVMVMRDLDSLRCFLADLRTERDALGAEVIRLLEVESTARANLEGLTE
jgi:GTPase SAR1 family protein